MNHHTNTDEGVDHPPSDFSELRDRVGRLEAGLAENTASTNRIEKGVADVLEAMSFVKTGFKFFAVTGRIVRKIVVWSAPFLTIAGAIWALAHGRFPDRP